MGFQWSAFYIGEQAAGFVNEFFVFGLDPFDQHRGVNDDLRGRISYLDNSE